MKWHRKAADAGHVDSQYVISCLYLRGNGLPQDYILAHMWANIAASSGDRDAAWKRDEIAEKMSIGQIEEAQKLARQWKPSNGITAEIQQGDGKDKLLSTGTGFVISRQGHVLTNYHVVENCAAIRTMIDGSSVEAKVVGSDAENDLAVLRIPVSFPDIIRFREGRSIRPGDGVIVVGFPLAGLLFSGAQLTTGTVSALAGIGNNTHFIQITAPIQPGNSGGPVLDLSGNAVGVVAGKLNALAVARITGDIPQNINFAINGVIAKAFLDSHNVEYETATSLRKYENAEIGAKAAKYTLLLGCYR